MRPDSYSTSKNKYDANWYLVTCGAESVTVTLPASKIQAHLNKFSLSERKLALIVPIDTDLVFLSRALSR